MSKVKKSVKETAPSPQLAEELTPDNTSAWWQKILTFLKNNIRPIILLIVLLAIVVLSIFIFYQNTKDKGLLEYTKDRESLEKSDALLEESDTDKSLFQLFEKPEQTQKQLPEPSPSPIWILPGKETYTISQNSKEGPRVKNISIDPQDPTINNSSQTITAELNHSQPIDQVQLKLISDNEEKLATMNLIEGTNKNGIWTTNWEITDSILYNYILTLTATSQDGQSIIDLTIR